MKKLKILLLLGGSMLVSSCDLSQIPGLDKRLSPEDSKAIGAACRHSGRALEDCFKLNPMAHQAGVFDGWRDMNDYMLANKIEVVVPQIQEASFSKEGNAADGHDAPFEHSSNKEGDSKSADKSTSGGGEESTSHRWVPPGADANLAKKEESKHSTDAPGEKASSTPDTKSEAAPDSSNTRPWERKKDPKNHT